MSTLAPAVAARVSITLADEKFLCGGLTLADIGAIESELLSRRPNLLRMAAEAGRDQPPEIQKLLIDRAIEETQRAHKIDIDEVIEWAQTDPHGVAFATWLLLTRYYPDRKFTFDDVADKLTNTPPADHEQNQDRIASASGTDILGNSTGPATAGQTEATETDESATGES